MSNFKSVFLTIILIAASGSSISKDRDITHYLNLEQGGLGNRLSSEADAEDIRLKSMKEAAIHLGIQVGFNDELESIYKEVSKISPEMNKIFDFGVLMRSTNSGAFEMHMLPGVVEEYDGAINVSLDGQSVTTTKKRIEIVESERMVSESPDWRNYLLTTRFVELQQPYEQVLPKNESEKEKILWRENFLKGYEIGVSQANAEVIAKVQNLRRDFVGRVKYIRYTLDGKITPPKLSLYKRDIVSSERELRINENTFTINKGAVFNPNTGEWELIALDNREGFRRGGENGKK